MSDLRFWLELAVVLACIVMGTRVGGAGVGLWGGVGVGVLVFVFQRAARRSAGVGGRDHPRRRHGRVADAGRPAGSTGWSRSRPGSSRANPKRITLVAPLTAFAFSVGAGTSNILYPLMPVIYDVSYRNGIRPSRPMSVSVVQSGVALAASPVSAAMAAMLTLTDVAAVQPRAGPDPRHHAAGLHRRHRRDVVGRRPDGPRARRRPGGAGEDPFRPAAADRRRAASRGRGRR